MLLAERQLVLYPEEGKAKKTKNEKNTMSAIVKAALFDVIVKCSECNVLYLLPV